MSREEIDGDGRKRTEDGRGTKDENGGN